jgi:hypothetical protein
MDKGFAKQTPYPFDMIIPSKSYTIIGELQPLSSFTERYE